MDRSRRRRISWLAGVIAVAALLGVGFATYVLGGRGEQRAVPAVPMVDAQKAPKRGYELTEALRLAWGRGPRDVWVDESWFGSTFESFAVDSRGRILVADHPKWHVGARVRRFSAEGRLERTWLTPSGSTFFEPSGDGIMYVLARGEGSSERVVFVREDGSAEGTFGVPPAVNSTALLRAGALVGVTNQVPDVTLADRTMRIEEGFFGVARVTTSGPVASAGGNVAAFGVDTSGRLYARLRRVDGFTLDAPTVQTLTLVGGRRLRLPDRATPIGVDGDTVWFAMPVSTGPNDRLDRPGWPLGAAPDAEVLAARTDGTLQLRAIVPWSPRLANSQRRLFVTPGTLWVADADSRGVVVRRYKAVGE